MKRTGIMGGTFNPIHNGHLQLAKYAMEYFSLENVLFVPTGNSYMKTNVLDTKHRVNMTKLAIEDNPFFELSTIEADMPGNSYTYKTLQILTEQNKDTCYYFITGADAVLSMGKWVEPQKIFENCIVAATVRDNFNTVQLNAAINEYEQKFNANIKLFSMPLIEISSTMIRDAVKEQLDISPYVPRGVYAYIQANNLYI